MTAMYQRIALLPILVATLLFIITGCSDQLTGPNESASGPQTTIQKGPANGLTNTANSVFHLDFSASTDAADVGPSSPGWQVDRQDVDTWETAIFDGDKRLHINIDESGPTPGFRSEQGKKYLPEEGGHWATGHNSSLSYRFYIDPDWETDGGKRQQTGMWGVVANENGDIVAYPVIEYQDSDAATNPNEGADPGDGAQFRIFLQTDEWENLGLPQKAQVDPDEGGWVHVRAQFVFDGSNPRVKWYINGAHVATDETIDRFGDPALFLEPILNSENFGEDEDYYYDDISLNAPGHAKVVKGQSSSQGANPN